MVAAVHSAATNATNHDGKKRNQSAPPVREELRRFLGGNPKRRHQIAYQHASSAPHARLVLNHRVEEVFHSKPSESKRPVTQHSNQESRASRDPGKVDIERHDVAFAHEAGCVDMLREQGLGFGDGKEKAQLILETCTGLMEKSCQESIFERWSDIFRWPDHSERWRLCKNWQDLSSKLKSSLSGADGISDPLVALAQSSLAGTAPVAASHGYNSWSPWMYPKGKGTFHIGEPRADQAGTPVVAQPYGTRHHVGSPDSESGSYIRYDEPRSKGKLTFDAICEDKKGCKVALVLVPVSALALFFCLGTVYLDAPPLSPRSSRMSWTERLTERLTSRWSGRTSGRSNLYYNA